jgi:hypothetical protein
VKKKKKYINNEKYRNNKRIYFWISRARNILGLKYSDIAGKGIMLSFKINEGTVRLNISGKIRE